MVEDAGVATERRMGVASTSYCKDIRGRKQLIQTPWLL